MEPLLFRFDEDAELLVSEVVLETHVPSPLEEPASPPECDRVFDVHELVEFVYLDHTYSLKSGTLSSTESEGPGETVRDGNNNMPVRREWPEKDPSGDHTDSSSDSDSEGSGSSSSAEYSCKLCGHDFDTYEECKRHVRRECEKRHQYPCEDCDKKFPTLKSLTAHARTHSGEKPFQCKYCAKYFAKEATLRPHVKLHESKPGFECQKCELSFLTVKRLAVHAKQVHATESTFQCDACDKKFTSAKKLLLHEKTHVPVQYFECEECGKSFRAEGPFEKHRLRAHRFKRQFQCLTCEKHFISENSLVKHRATHDQPTAL